MVENVRLMVEPVSKYIGYKSMIFELTNYKTAGNRLAESDLPFDSASNPYQSWNAAWHNPSSLELSPC